MNQIRDAPTRWFVGLGLVHLALTLLTRFVSSDRAPTSGRWPRARP